MGSTVYITSWHHVYDILGDSFQNMAETLVVKEKEISRIKGRNKVRRSPHGM